VLPSAIDQVVQAMPFLEIESSTVSDLRDPTSNQNLLETYLKVRANFNLASVGGLSAIFGQLCNMKMNMGLINDFTVTRSSLEQVFV